MDNFISLDWQQFDVDVSKINNYFKNTLSSDYDGLVCRENNLLVMFKNEISQSDKDLVNDYWTSINENSFDETNSEKWNVIREQRILRFQETEWIKLRHRDQQDRGIPTTLSVEQYQDWLDYWQALRDLPETYSNPDDVVFPSKPST